MQNLRTLLFLDERSRYDEIGLCAQVIDTILSLLVNIIEKANLCHCFKRKTVVTLTSYNLCISTLMLKLGIKFFFIYNR